jgi:O-antigen ligase
MKKRAAKKISSENKISLRIIKYLFLILIFLAPLNNGMFFEAQFWPIAIIIAVLFFYFIYKKGLEIKFGIPEFLLLLLAGSYFLSFLGSASPHQAYVGFLKYIFYFAACFLTAQLWGEEEEGKKAVLLTIISAITVGTIMTFLAQAQILEETNLIIGRRFSSTFHYANTYAAILAASLPLTAYLFLVSTRKGVKALLLAAWFLNTVAFYATLSRGALLVYLPALLFLLFFLEKGQRGLTLGNLLLINALALVSANFILQNPDLKTIYILLIGLALVLFFNLLVETKALRTPFFVVLIIVLLLAGAVIAVEYFPEKASLAKLARLKDINLETGGAVSRFYFYEDAFRLFQEHWLIGTGAGGWGALYKMRQGHLYDSTEVHSSVLQIMVESGIIGIVLFLGIFGFLIGQQIWRSRKQKSTVLERIVLLAIFVLFFHSLIDFDLTVTAVPLCLFVLVGLLGSEYSLKLRYHKPLKIISLILSSILFFSVASMGLAHLASRQALAEIRMEKSVKVSAIAQYERDLAIAQKLAPLNPVYPSYLGQVKVVKGLQQKSTEEIEQGLQILERAIKLEPYQYEAYLTKGSTLVQLQRRVEAIPYFEKIITLMPMQHTGYEFVIENYVQLALETGEKDYLDLACKVYSRAEKQMQKVEPERLPFWQHEKLNESAFTNFHVGVAECLAEEYAQGVEHFTLALKRATGSLREKTIAWLAVAQEKQGLPVTVQIDSQKGTEIESIIQDFMIKSKEK